MTIPTDALRQIAEHSAYPESQAIAAELLACREDLAAERERFNLLSQRCDASERERDAARAEAEQARRDGQEIASGLHEKLAEVRAELAAVKRQRDELLAASEPVADALRDIAWDGHRAYLDAYESAVAKALAAEQPKPSDAVQVLRDAAENCTGEMFGEQAAVKPKPPEVQP